MNKRVSIAVMASLALVILFSYQNCGVEAPQQMFDKLKSYQLPYDVKVDQVAYMSCSEQDGIPNDQGVFFTFRAGAYGSSAGLRLSDSFIYDTRRSSPANRATILQDEGTSLDYRVQFSIRQQSDLTTLYQNSNTGRGIEEMDYDFIFGSLGSKEMSASLALLETGKYLNYWAPGGISQDAYMQGTMVFNSSENLASNLRNFMGTKGILTVGYSRDDEPTKFLTPADYSTTKNTTVPGNQGFGVGLRLAFKQPDPLNWSYAGVPHNSLPSRVLKTVTELDLSVSGGSGTAWTCPSTLQLRIVYPDDKDALDPGNGTVRLCPDAADPVTPAADVALFKRVRNSLPASDWKINWSRKCVVPKRSTTGSCYGIDNGTHVARNPVYDFTRTCNPALNPACLHFVSICYKQ